MSGDSWQPIQTAEDDFADALIWADGYFKPRLAWRDGDGKWRISGTAHFLPEPTHWMPLPAAPSQEPTA